ncbi:DUF2911 domain-containing protein [Xanthomarina sp. F2636L]|uniref:DUF2911 domain-containing protein n=1 Tax=Xanthomarina sp. F2636L TaxID=2996018 RepID=UPI00225DEAE5|nr:DUF2911 domain-containing protein [Xanthomarina sp. F2636L]MCX7550325.1 DUF2911 domain-containing protein [Xanthomarina sp. F2636L]
MKNILLLFAVAALSINMSAQVTTPQSSPFSKVEQKVGLTDVTIEYSRPGVKGRTVFGDLVPYDKVWRMGANKNTIITFSDNVTIMGQLLKAGSYAIFAKPGEKVWEVLFYSDTENWGTPEKWDDGKVAARVNAEVYPVPFNVETFTIDINQITNSGAALEILWEKTYVAVPFSVPTDEIVLKSINDALNGTPKASDYYAAAVYYSQEGKDIKQAKEWMDKAMSMMDKPMFYQIRQQSIIYAKAGDIKGAIELAKKSLDGAKEAGNDDYVKMNLDSLKEWEN